MKNTFRQNVIRWVTLFLKSKVTTLGLIFCLILPSIEVTAQRFSFEYWHDGSLTLVDGDVQSGKIKYDFENEVIQFQSDRGVNSAYTCKSFLKFEIMDELQGKPRIFYSLPYSPEGGYESPRLFEVLMEGKMNLLSREEKQTVRRNQTYGLYMLPSQEDLVLSYYIL